jgi:hypothetical protein
VTPSRSHSNATVERVVVLEAFALKSHPFEIVFVWDNDILSSRICGILSFGSDHSLRASFARLAV